MSEIKQELSWATQHWPRQESKLPQLTHTQLISKTIVKHFLGGQELTPETAADKTAITETAAYAYDAFWTAANKLAAHGDIEEATALVKAGAISVDAILEPQYASQRARADRYKDLLFPETLGGDNTNFSKKHIEMPFYKEPPYREPLYRIENESESYPGGLGIGRRTFHDELDYPGIPSINDNQNPQESVSGLREYTNSTEKNLY